MNHTLETKIVSILQKGTVSVNHTSNYYTHIIYISISTLFNIRISKYIPIEVEYETKIRRLHLAASKLLNQIEEINIKIADWQTKSDQSETLII